MNCKHCNAALEADMAVCPECGKPVEAEEVTEVAAPAEEIPAAEVTPEEIPETVETAVEAAAEAEEEDPAEEAEETEEGSEEATEEAEEATGEAEAPKPRKTWKLIASIGCAVVLLGVLVVAILYGMGVDLTKRADNIQYKASYTVSDEVAVRRADKVVATMAGDTLTNAQLQAHFFTQIYQFMEEFGTYYFTFNQPLDEQICMAETQMTWQQYFLDATLENWRRYQILNQLAKEEGFTPDLSDLDTIAQELESAAATYGFGSADELVQSDMGAACSLEAYLDYIRFYRTGNEYISYKMQQCNPTDEDLAAYFAQKEQEFAQSGITKTTGMIAAVRHILVIPEGEKVEGEYTEAQWAEALKKAEGLLEEWKKGAATEESFAEMAKTHTEDGGSKATGGLYEDIMPGSNYAESFLNWSVDAARVPGETGIVQTNYGYHIMYYVSGEEVWLRAARDNYPADMINALLEENSDRWEMKIRYRNIVVTDANVD